MDHMNEKQRGHGCGCGGPAGREREPASETPPSGEGRVVSTALDLLDERFARGEIDKAEYQEKKQLISQRATTPKPDAPDCDQLPATAQSKPELTDQDGRRR